MRQNLTTIRDLCLQNLLDLEFWPTYYSRRYLEFLSYLDLFPKKTLGATLELGSGIGYHSAFLAQISESVIGTDIEVPKVLLHAGGLARAKKLAETLKVPNLTFVTCSAESLPFPDSSFDFVYSSSVFHYVQDKEHAVSEVLRVLRKGGVHFCVVPSRFYHLTRLIEFYVYLIKRSFIRIWQLWSNLFVLKKTSTIGTKKNFLQSNPTLKNFPLPPTQGVANSWFDEVSINSASRWKTLLLANGAFKFIGQYSTMLGPFHQVLGMISPSLSVYLYQKTRKLELVLGQQKTLKWLGINSATIVQKI